MLLKKYLNNLMSFWFLSLHSYSFLTAVFFSYAHDTCTVY